MFALAGIAGSKLWTVIDALHIPDIPFIWEDDSEPLYTHGGVVDFDWDDIDFAGALRSHFCTESAAPRAQTTCVVRCTVMCGIIVCDLT